MRNAFRHQLIVAAHFCALACTTAICLAAAPLASWNDGPAKHSIIAFVEKVTKESSPDFVPVSERIATFDITTGGPKGPPADSRLCGAVQM